MALAAPECRTYVSAIREGSVNYCIHRSRPDIAAQPDEPVVYFFHGIGGSAQSWKENGYAEALDTLSPEEHFPAFTVVSFDTAKMSFFSDRADQHTGPSAYESWFIKEFMPFIEKTYGVCGQRRCRGVIGLSMGGYGAIKTGLKYNDLFSYIGINSAAIAPFNIWNGLVDWNAYFSRHPIGWWKGQVLLQEIRRVFTTREMYQQNDPTALLESITTPEKMPHLYLDVGGQDYFGFQEGYFRITKIMDERQWAYQSFFDPNGGHEIFHDRRWWLMRFVRDQVQASSDF
ncbi:MAG: alpha/beta hydrolase-fold protein [Bdellovibrionota bacterium]